MERVADYVVRKVNEAGAKHIFLITGRGILYLTDAVAKNKDIIPISTYHEQGASYAAMAYCAVTGKLSACLVSTGCAATNAITACLCAYQDNLPLIFISGNNRLSENVRHTGVPIRTYGSQETDIVSIVSSCTKYSVMLEDKDMAAFETEKAIYIAQQGRRGPVWIDIPLDVQNMRIDEAGLTHFTPTMPAFNKEQLFHSVYNIAKDINAAKRPILLIGGGAKKCASLISDFVNKSHIPVVFSPSACDVYGTDNEFSIGAIGSIGGSRAGNFVIQNADYILALGSKLCSQLTGVKEHFAREAKITAVDIDSNEHKKDGVHIDTIINADVVDILRELSVQNVLTVSKIWQAKCAHWKDIFSISNEQFVKELISDNKLDIYIVANILSDNLSDDATIITDAGFEELIIPSTIKFGKNRRCLFPASQGAMGYAIPAVIGAYAARRKNIVVIVGDGSFMMNMQELGIIASMNIPAKIFVINNNMYAVIRKRQQDLFRKRTIGNDSSDGLPSPNFAKIAACFDMEYEKIETYFDLLTKSKSYYKNDSLTLIEVVCDSEQKYLHESYALNEKRRLVHRAIEDMSPFWDREIIKNEMLVDMIEN